MAATPLTVDPASYPPARRDESVSDTYFGTEVPDPYRWLEDPDAEETKAFVDAQNALTQTVLAQCDLRDKFKARMTQLYNFKKFGCPFKRGSRYFFYMNTGLQAQYVLYMQSGLDSEPEVFLDPNLLSEDGTVALGATSFSEDGELMAYGLSSSGSDWQTMKVRRVSDKQELPDTLQWVKFSSIAWTHDHKGFFYNRYPEPSKGKDGDAGTETDINLNQKLYYHALGTDQSEDVLIWEDPEHPKWMFGAEISDDGRYLMISPDEGCDPVNRFYVCDLTGLPEGSIQGWAKAGGGALPVLKLIDNFEAKYEYITNDATSFTLFTNKDAPLYKVVRVDIAEPEGVWSEVIPQSEIDVLDWVHCVNDRFLLTCYLHDVKHVLELRELATGTLLQKVPLDIGSVTSATGRRQDAEAFFTFTSFLSPGTIFRLDLTVPEPEPRVFKEIEVAGFDRSKFQTEQVFVTSKDGTRVPMFVISRAGTVLDGSAPCLLYGYGGFNINIMPSFSVSRLVLVQNLGAVVAVANIRGGNEYGERWHKGGSLGNKQNCFDDFQSCGEYLIANGYTQAPKLCIEGGSNGGLLVAACANQRPDLFGIALPHVGVMDMLRFHKFTIGHAWTTDYGCADKNEEEFNWLIKYSPVHNVRRPWDTKPGVQYPATMVLTADHDDRVVPLHSLKLLATLQHVLGGEGSQQQAPVIARVDTKAGHGAGRPTQKIIDEASDTYGFLARVAGAIWLED